MVVGGAKGKKFLGFVVFPEGKMQSSLYLAPVLNSLCGKEKRLARFENESPGMSLLE